jgi:hypothetical protein
MPNERLNILLQIHGNRMVLITLDIRAGKTFIHCVDRLTINGGNICCGRRSNLLIYTLH